MTLNSFDIEYKKAFRVCSVQDSAIDIVKSNLSEYGRTCNETHLTFIPGQQPTWFYLRWLGQTTFAQILSTTTNDILKLQLAFSYCVEKIENAPNDTAVILPKVHIPSLGHSIFDLADIEELIDFPTRLWIGGVAHDRHFLVNGIEQTYSLPLPLVKYIASKEEEKQATPRSVGRTTPSRKKQSSRTTKKQSKR